MSRYIYHVNNYCNLHCEFCSDFSNIPIDPKSPFIERRKKWDVPIAEVELFCERFNGIELDKKIHLTGGEPTAINKEKFETIIDLFHSYDRNLVLVTNGYNLLGIEKNIINKIQTIKLDDHGINHEHITSCVTYLKKFYNGKIFPIETLHHYDLGKTRKLSINKGGHCGRNTLRTKIEVLIKQGVFYPCCAMASFDLYDNNKRMETELKKAGWHLDNRNIFDKLSNWKETLPEYVLEQCRTACWWPDKRVLGKTRITLKPNDVLKKAKL